MNNSNIQNIFVIAHTDHGKTTLVESLVSNRTIKKEEDSDITTMGSLFHYDLPDSVPLPLGLDSRRFLLNLIDTPTVDIGCRLKESDDALVVVDVVEGVCVSGQAMLQLERINSVLFINKMDRLILELQLDSEDAYQTINRIVETINVSIQLGGNGSNSKQKRIIDPVVGNVAFGSGVQGWAFTLENWAALYETKLGVPKEKLLRRLWGNNFFDDVNKKWVSNRVSEDGRTLKRGFCFLIYEPLRDIILAANEKNSEKLTKQLYYININLTNAELEQTSRKELICTVMKRFLLINNCIISMVVKHLLLPSPSPHNNII
ncbi:hypothetical protein PPL_08993 [Heterostelium album PN500]|uniref:Tr-type G domain-containing protein n=1 Tax=Heterostelium pallidum (strain ATCC 26659 / Pp 5 / PN500) TaxID=670386 RepID=D3BKB2_HETP5|nr:hypothetical protein PPL_08993 [Heterostelium album PN500]EFA78342.1 hypothetical protein PPL_08993 [Heterostelium album PN500]|eukprot:XP_020430467.1 hypothetical protein PPL_08993 [Heterostelium album PN500]